jgi:hypothetical protein
LRANPGRPGRITPHADRLAKRLAEGLDPKSVQMTNTVCQDAAAIYRETGDRHREGMALGNLGPALAEIRRFDEAITTH